MYATRGAGNPQCAGGGSSTSHNSLFDSAGVIALNRGGRLVLPDRFEFPVNHFQKRRALDVLNLVAAVGPDIAGLIRSIRENLASSVPVQIQDAGSDHARLLELQLAAEGIVHADRP